MNIKHLSTVASVFAFLTVFAVASTASAQIGIDAKVDVKAGIDARPLDGEVRGEASGQFMATGSRPEFERPESDKKVSLIKGRMQVTVGTVTSIDGGSIVITDKNDVDFTFSATSTRFFSETGTTSIAVSDLEVGDVVKAADLDAAAKIEAKLESKGFFGRVWGAFRAFFGGSRDN